MGQTHYPAQSRPGCGWHWCPKPHRLWPPAWVWLARLFIGHVPASETTMTIAGLLELVPLPDEVVDEEDIARVVRITRLSRPTIYRVLNVKTDAA